MGLSKTGWGQGLEMKKEKKHERVSQLIQMRVIS